MNNSQPTDTLKLQEDLVGRIANLAMKPSYANTLIPLFEAITNSIQSVQDRFGENWEKKCDIEVQILQDENRDTHSFKIIDNGIGLNKQNFESFRTYDSRLKVTRGGKGVGRLTWLKVFEEVEVSSVFEEGSKKFMRKFLFVLDNAKPFQSYDLSSKSEETELKTCIILRNFKTGYRNDCPKRFSTIVNRVAAHFLPFLIGSTKPKILVRTCTESENLADLVENNIYHLDTKSIEIDELGSFQVEHLYINKTLVETGDEHKIYLTAHNRIVKEHGINGQTGLDGSVKHSDIQAYYVGLVSGKFLDENVTQERNNFDISSEDFKAIAKDCEYTAKVFLHEPIKEIIDSKSKRVAEVILNFPRFAYLVSNAMEFAQKLPLNRKSEEDIFRELSVYDYRASREVKNELKSIGIDGRDVTNSPEMQRKVKDLMKKIGQQERASLAEYVSKRKLVIDLLQERLRFENKENEVLHKEKAIHQIFCPLNASSDDIDYGSHNLWLLDDRLAFYDFWASDKSIRSFAKTSDAKERPDLILFNGAHLLHRKGTDQPVVIVEFKRPAREGFSDNENPIMQILNYVRKLRNNEIADNKGTLITKIGMQTPFFCYLIADITPSLKNILESHELSQQLPGSRGYYGYNKSLGVYFEVLEYDRIVADARLRHEGFFQKLGIN